MKKILTIMAIFVIGLGIIPAVNAEESDLTSIASITEAIGGSDKEIIQTDSANKYKFYYKYVAIDSTDFSTYITAKYTSENAPKTSEDYTTASTQVAEYEGVFKGLIPTVTVSDLQSWTLSEDGNISLNDLKYESGKHNGYVLAVAAVKDGDTSKVYITRLIKESTSETTLGEITYTAEDQAAYQPDEDATTSDEGANTSVTTNSNPNTGISDYAIYLVPICIILGSGILLRRKYS